MFFLLDSRKTNSYFMRMKNLLLCIAIMAGLFAGLAPSVSAQSTYWGKKKVKKEKFIQIEDDEAAAEEDEDDSKSSKKSKKAKKAKQPASPIIPAVKRVKKVKGNVNAKADYYIYLFSASWCGPCCKEMPNIVKTYKDMKKSGKVDIILFCQDRTPEDAKEFVKKFRIPFMTIMGNDSKVSKVPGYSPASGIPHCIVVDRYGQVITRGHPGSLLRSWEALTVDKGVPEPPAED